MQTPFETEPRENAIYFITSTTHGGIFFAYDTKRGLLINNFEQFNRQAKYFNLARNALSLFTVVVRNVLFRGVFTRFENSYFVYHQQI